jgi:hypothetical protein
MSFIALSRANVNVDRRHFEYFSTFSTVGVALLHYLQGEVGAIKLNGLFHIHLKESHMLLESLLSSFSINDISMALRSSMF